MVDTCIDCRVTICHQNMFLISNLLFSIKFQKKLKVTTMFTLKRSKNNLTIIVNILIDTINI